MEGTPAQCIVKALEEDPKLATAWNNLGMQGGGTVNGVAYTPTQCLMMGVLSPVQVATYAAPAPVAVPAPMAPAPMVRASTTRPRDVSHGPGAPRVHSVWPDRARHGDLPGLRREGEVEKG